MSVAAPPSPGAPSEIEDDDPPEAGGAEAVEVAGSDAAPADDDAVVKPTLTSFAKSFYVINPQHIRYDENRPYVMESGLAMYALHESKSFKSWSEDHVVRPRHIVKVVAGGQCGWYIRFAQDGVQSDDRTVARSIHKQIAKRFFDLWNKEWPAERKAKYAELLRDEPSDTKQVNPERVGWEQVEAPADIIYERPKKEKKETAAPLQGAIGKAGGKPPAKGKLAKMAVADDDDDQSSAAMSAPPATPNDTAMVGFRPQPHMGMPSSAPNIFLQTPGMVTISESYLQQLIANQRQ